MAKLNNGKRELCNLNRTLHQLHAKLSTSKESLFTAIKKIHALLRGLPCRGPQNTAVSTASSALPLRCPISVTHTVASKFRALMSAKKVTVSLFSTCCMAMCVRGSRDPVSEQCCRGSWKTHISTNMMVFVVGGVVGCRLVNRTPWLSGKSSAL